MPAPTRSTARSSLEAHPHPWRRGVRGSDRDLFESRFESNLIATVLAGVRAGRYPNCVPLFACGAQRDVVQFAALCTPPWDMLATDIGARQCPLYTDATNPTSNKIYAEVGYRRYGEHEEWTFEGAPAAAG